MTWEPIMFNIELIAFAAVLLLIAYSEKVERAERTLVRTVRLIRRGLWYCVRRRLTGR